MLFSPVHQALNYTIRHLQKDRMQEKRNYLKRSKREHTLQKVYLLRQTIIRCLQQTFGHSFASIRTGNFWDRNTISTSSKLYSYHQKQACSTERFYLHIGMCQVILFLRHQRKRDFHFRKLKFLIFPISKFVQFTEKFMGNVDCTILISKQFFTHIKNCPPEAKTLSEVISQR